MTWFSNSSSTSTASTNADGSVTVTNTNNMPSGTTIITIINFVIFFILGFYFSWKWNAKSSAGARFFFAFFAGLWAPWYLLFTLIARGEYIKYVSPTNNGSYTSMSQVAQRKQLSQGSQKRQTGQANKETVKTNLE